MTQAIKTEILRLHKDFADWYNAKVTKENKIFNSKITNTLDKNFHIVLPDGYEYNKDSFCKMVYKDYGTDKDFLIKIKYLKIRKLEPNLFLARYEEWQYFDKNIQSKRTTVSILKKDKKSKIIWIHIHESPIKYTPEM